MALTSKFSLLFNKLIEKIEADVTDIRFIDQDWNQLDEENPRIAYPCVLIDFPDTAFGQMQGYQHGDATVRLKLIYRSFTASSNITPGANRETALQFYELEKMLCDVLQAWYADGLLVNAMIRTGASTEKRDDGLRVRVIDFSCSFVEDSN
ncbi:MAG: hypothetical protein ACT4OJ_14220 [Bacteroidota bacterium]